MLAHLQTDMNGQKLVWKIYICAIAYLLPTSGRSSQLHSLFDVTHTVKKNSSWFRMNSRTVWYFMWGQIPISQKDTHKFTCAFRTFAIIKMHVITILEFVLSHKRIWRRFVPLKIQISDASLLHGWQCEKFKYLLYKLPSCLKLLFQLGGHWTCIFLLATNLFSHNHL